MRYVAHVMVAFLDDAKAQTVFEVWESTLVFEACSHGQALRQALSDSRTMFDDPENWRALGYPEKPRHYAVRWLQDETDLPTMKASCDSGFVILTMIGTFDETQMDEIMSFKEVLVPYRIMYTD